VCGFLEESVSFVLREHARESLHLLGYIDVDSEIRSRETDSLPLRNVE